MATGAGSSPSNERQVAASPNDVPSHVQIRVRNFTGTEHVAFLDTSTFKTVRDLSCEAVLCPAFFDKDDLPPPCLIRWTLVEEDGSGGEHSQNADADNMLVDDEHASRSQSKSSQEHDMRSSCRASPSDGADGVESQENDESKKVQGSQQKFLQVNKEVEQGQEDDQSQEVEQGQEAEGTPGPGVQENPENEQSQLDSDADEMSEWESESSSSSVSSSQSCSIASEESTSGFLSPDTKLQFVQHVVYQFAVVSKACDMRLRPDEADQSYRRRVARMIDSLTSVEEAHAFLYDHPYSNIPAQHLDLLWGVLPTQRGIQIKVAPTRLSSSGRRLRRIRSGRWNLMCAALELTATQWSKRLQTIQPQPPQPHHLLVAPFSNSLNTYRTYFHMEKNNGPDGHHNYAGEYFSPLEDRVHRPGQPVRVMPFPGPDHVFPSRSLFAFGVAQHIFHHGPHAEDSRARDLFNPHLGFPQGVGRTELLRVLERALEVAHVGGRWALKMLQMTIFVDPCPDRQLGSLCDMQKSGDFCQTLLKQLAKNGDSLAEFFALLPHHDSCEGPHNQREWKRKIRIGVERTLATISKQPHWSDDLREEYYRRELPESISDALKEVSTLQKMSLDLAEFLELKICQKTNLKYDSALLRKTLRDVIENTSLGGAGSSSLVYWLRLHTRSTVLRVCNRSLLSGSSRRGNGGARCHS
ncbi:unnamed protein product [Amoebophrya sp. A120]|nr:unnamed protein product [Amoebophrya sp. A120]|eukprot:GSA120T00001597001.1